MYLLFLFFSDDNMQRKVANLRSMFSRELRLIKESKRSGCGTSEVRQSKWPYFQALSFLLPVLAVETATVSNMGAEASFTANDLVGDTVLLIQNYHTHPC